MKNATLIAILAFVIVSCKNNKETKTVEVENYATKTLDVTTSVYPKNISKVFKAHGGLYQWNIMQNLVFEMDIPEGSEKTRTNLKNRKSLIETSKFKIGFDGSNVWLSQQDSMAYKGNAKFYYNLMFYFYAMPFVFADSGIVYQDTEPLLFNNIAYPGIKISYESGIGESSDDEYILYYNKDTHKMEWLSYTVTYFSKEKSKEFHLIKYKDWQTVSGLQLPKALQWYHYENKTVGKPKDEVLFKNVVVSKEKPNDNLFEKPEDGVIVE